MARDRYLEKFIDSRFADLKEDLKRIEDKNDDRDDMVREMDKSNKERLDSLERDVGFVKNIFKAIGALLTMAGAAVGIWKGVH